MEELKKIIRLAVKKGASDVHLVSGAVPYFRIHKKLFPVKKPKIENRDLDKIIRSLLSQEQAKKLEAFGDVDVGLVLVGVTLRINVHKQVNGFALSIRILPAKIPSKDEISMPDKIAEVANMTEGLVIISGTAGSGKSTTLAVLIELMNSSRSLHIITLEDPIEYRFNNRKCLIEQRQLGTDFKSFPEGLKNILRQDPDVIVVGEMRDPESISLALTAAETGHLVLSTLHAPNASEAVERIVGVFDGMEQRQILIQLSATLRLILAQQLLPAKAGGVIPVHEILVTNKAIQNAIRLNDLSTIRSAIQTGKRFGMISLEQHMKELISKKLI